MKKLKVLIVSLCAILLVAASVLGTLAYLTDDSEVVNTFTVGKVKIELDEAKVKLDGTLDGNERVKENTYHLIPGMTYVKDPTMTVVKGSEESYVRMLVTINCYDKLTEIFGNSFLPQYFVEGWDNTVWKSTEVIELSDDGKTATYEFRYFETVKPEADTDLVLDALFDSITVPGSMSSDDMEAIAGLNIKVIGHAIQAAGFDDADAAWTAFDEEMNN